jgi:hypothetical protein
VIPDTNRESWLRSSSIVVGTTEPKCPPNLWQTGIRQEWKLALRFEPQGGMNQSGEKDLERVRERSSVDAAQSMILIPHQTPQILTPEAIPIAAKPPGELPIHQPTNQPTPTTGKR